MTASDFANNFLCFMAQCVFLLWCMSPLEGSTTIYTRVIRPYFLKHQSVIDDAAKKATDGLSKFADSAMEKGTIFFWLLIGHPEVLFFVQILHDPSSPTLDNQKFFNQNFFL